MKKLLQFLGAFTLIASSGITVIACSDPNDNGKPEPPVENKLDWTKEDIEKRLGIIKFKDLTETIRLQAFNFAFVNDTQSLVMKSHGEELEFIANNILPSINKNNPYSFDLMSSFTFNESLIYDESSEEKQYFWQQITDHNWADFKTNDRLDIYLRHSNFITGAINVESELSWEEDRTLYYKVLKTNYFLGEIYSNFENLLKEFQEKYDQENQKFELNVRENGKDAPDYYFNIEVKNLEGFSWLENNLEEQKTNSELLSECIEEYISQIVKDYSETKLEGKEIPLSFGKLEVPNDKKNFYYQKGLTIGDYVKYDDDFYRLYVL